MKKLLFPLTLVALLSSEPGPLTGSMDTVVGHQSRVCHVTGQANHESLGLIEFGRVIEVSASAARAHLDHRDHLAYTDMDEDLKAWVEDFFEISLADANCYRRTS